MATEVAHAPAAERAPLDVNSGADTIAGILAQGVETPETPEETEAPEEQVETENLQTEQEVQTEEPETETEVVEESAEAEKPEAKDKPAKDENEVTSEIELEPSQVAQMLGLEEKDIDVDDDGNVLLHTKINGKPAQATLKDLRHSYELAQTHEERLRELGRERKSFDEERQAYLANLSEQQQQLSYAITALEEDYAQNFQSVDWTRLREENPTEYNTKKLDYDDRRRRIEEYKARMGYQSKQLQEQYAQRVADVQAKGAEQLTEVFQGSAYKSAPAWDEAEMERLSKWIMDQGFSAQDISSVGVWQVFKWARDSMLRESELKQAKEAVRKVTTLPKVARPGRTKPAKEIKQSKVKELKTRQIKSGGGLKETTELLSNLFER